MSLKTNKNRRKTGDCHQNEGTSVYFSHEINYRQYNSCSIPVTKFLANIFRVFSHTFYCSYYEDYYTSIALVCVPSGSHSDDGVRKEKTGEHVNIFVAAEIRYIVMDKFERCSGVKTFLLTTVNYKNLRRTPSYSSLGNG